MEPTSSSARPDGARELDARRRRLLRGARRLLRDASRAEDVAQDALLAHAAKDASSPPAWWWTVGRRLAGRSLRGESRRREREAAAARSVVAEEEPLRRSLESERARAVHEALAGVAEPFRRTLVERYLHERTIAEIAASEGVGVRTVESRIRRGVERLRPLLRAHDPRSLAGLWIGARPFLPAALSAIGSTLSLGFLAMKLWALGIVVVAAGGLWWWAPWSGTEAPARTADVAATIPSLGATRSQSPVPGVARSPVSVEHSPVTAAPGDEPPAREPTGVQIEALRESTPPGTLAGSVLRGLEPVSGVEVRALHGADFTDLERPWWDRALARTFTDAEGRFRFEGVDAGDWVVGASCGRGPVRELFTALEEGEPGRSLLLVLGGASLEGTVFDPDGVAVAGALVHLSAKSAGASGAKSDDFHAFTLTDLHGRYRMEDLLSGSYWVSFEPSGDYHYWLSENCHTVALDLDPDEAGHLDEGSTAGWPRVEGRFLGRDGAPLHTSGTFLLAPEDGGYRRCEFDEQGRFTLRAAPGEYRLFVTVSGHEVKPQEPFVVEAGFTERNVVLPGTRLRGTLRREEGGDGGSGVSLHVWLTSEDGKTFFVPIDSDGRFVIEALAAGTWTMRTHPLVLDRPDGTLLLTIPESSFEVVVDERVKLR